MQKAGLQRGHRTGDCHLAQVQVNTTAAAVITSCPWSCAVGAGLAGTHLWDL